jgi:AcrR family transcriptional regulator
VPSTRISRESEPRRRRLGVEERREQLLSLGMELFSTRAYDEIWIEEIAERAGISRGLLYHYFPTKRDFYVEVSRRAAAEVRERTEPDPALPPLAQVRTALDAYLHAAEERPEGFLTAYRGTLAGDPEVRAIVEKAREAQADRILAAFVGKKRPSSMMRLAARGWVAFVQDVTARWLRERKPSRDEVRDMLVRALEGAIARTDP